MRFIFSILITATFFTSNIVHSSTYYISTAGSDGDSGATGSPWASFSHAMGKLVPGDTLIVKNGTYNQKISPTVSGTNGQKIRFVAENNGYVVIDAGGTGAALDVSDVSYLHFEGMKFQNSGENAVVSISSPDGQAATGNMATHHISAKHVAIKGSCLDNNCNGASIARVNDVLLEDIWAYGAGRYVLSIYGAKNVTIRRMVIRWDRWDGTNYKVNDPRFSMSVYNSHNNLLENIIFIDAGKTSAGGDKGAFTVAGGDNGITAPFTNSADNRFLGLILLNNDGTALDIEGRDIPHNNNLYSDSVIAYNGYAMVMNKNVTNTTISHVNIINNAGGLASWSTNVTKTSIVNSIITGNDSYAFRGDDISENFNVLNNNNPNYESGFSKGSSTAITNPQLTHITSNSTTVLDSLPASDSGNRGAMVDKQYVDGVKTNNDLWPWPNEEIIVSDLCNNQDLTAFGRTGANTAGLCASGKTLSAYILEYLGNSCPTGSCAPRMPQVQNVKIIKQ